MSELTLISAGHSNGNTLMSAPSTFAAHARMIGAPRVVRVRKVIGTVKCHYSVEHPASFGRNLDGIRRSKRV